MSLKTKLGQKEPKNKQKWTKTEMEQKAYKKTSPARISPNPCKSFQSESKENKHKCDTSGYDGPIDWDRKIEKNWQEICEEKEVSKNEQERELLGATYPL